MSKRTDTKVKKTFVRNSVQNVKTSESAEILYTVDSEPLPGASSSSSSLLHKKELNQPILCSSTSVANYLSNVKKSLPPPLSAETLESNRELSAKVTKTLNFHFNDAIYKNLIELNSSNEDTKINKKIKKPVSTGLKRDLEPNIEDFYQDEIKIDTPPKISVPKIKFKPIKKVENGNLHRLVASFENL